VERFHLEGVVPPNITPFGPYGDVYEEGLRRHVEFLLPHVGGLYSCGTYGSGPLMSVAERKRVLQIVVDQVQDRVPVVAHVGTTNTADAVELAKHAESAGAAAVAVVPPFYYRHTDDAIFEHYRSVLDATSIPVYAYDNPKASGNSISPQLLARLADIGIWGIKDSSFSISSFMNKQRAVGSRPFDFVIGTESLFVPAFALGARACVAGLANALPGLMAELWRASSGSDMDELNALQHKVLRARDIIHMGPTIPTVHTVLQMRGIDAGQPRRPLLPLGAEVRDRMRAALIDEGLL
jgi:4-hydroxy-tetrahydrodipicolinate synthase